MRAACSEISWSFVLCQEEDDYQSVLALSLPGVHRQLKRLALVATELLVLSLDLRRLYFIDRSTKWAWRYHFEVRVRERQKLFMVSVQCGTF